MARGWGGVGVGGLYIEGEGVQTFCTLRTVKLAKIGYD